LACRFALHRLFRYSHGVQSPAFAGFFPFLQHCDHVGDKLFGFTASGAVADGDDLDLKFANQRFERGGEAVRRVGFEQLVLDRETLHLRDSLVPRYAEMVYNGQWFAPERDAMQALVDRAQQSVTGVARLKLYKGGVSIAGRKSPNSLYDSALASFDEAGGYQQADADGFIRLNSMRLRALARLGRPKPEGNR